MVLSDEEGRTRPVCTVLTRSTLVPGGSVLACNRRADDLQGNTDPLSCFQDSADGYVRTTDLALDQVAADAPFRHVRY